MRPSVKARTAEGPSPSSQCVGSRVTPQSIGPGVCLVPKPLPNNNLPVLELRISKRQWRFVHLALLAALVGKSDCIARVWANADPEFVLGGPAGPLASSP